MQTVCDTHCGSCGRGSPSTPSQSFFVVAPVSNIGTFHMIRLSTARLGVKMGGGIVLSLTAGFILIAPGPLNLGVRVLVALLFALPGIAILVTVRSELG